MLNKSKRLYLPTYLLNIPPIIPPKKEPAKLIPFNIDTSSVDKFKFLFNKGFRVGCKNTWIPSFIYINIIMKKHII